MGRHQEGLICPTSWKVVGTEAGCQQLNYLSQTTVDKQLPSPELASGSPALEGLTHSLGHQGSSPPPPFAARLSETLELFLKSKQGLRAALAERSASRESQQQREQTYTAEPTPRPCDVSPTHCDITRWGRGGGLASPWELFINRGKICIL